MKTSTVTVFSAFAVAVSLYACKPDPVEPDPVTPTGNRVVLSFDHVCGNDSLIIDQTLRYENLNGDSFSCEVLRYYISNISLTDNLGNTWYEAESYHLVDAADPASTQITLDGVPSGTYTSVRYMIGVDSTRNVSGSQTGALDPDNGMFWTWNSGYIMAKMEGRSPSSTQPFGIILFHMGGFSGQYATQRWCTPTFSTLTSNVSASTTSTIHIKTDIHEWFQTPLTVDFATMNNVTTAGAQAAQIADNYANMFYVTWIDN